MKVRVIFFLFLIISLGSTSNFAQVKYELKFSDTTLKKKFSKFISIDTSIALSENKSIRIEVYHIIYAFYSQFNEPKKSTSKHIISNHITFI